MRFETYDARDDLFYTALFAIVGLIAVAALAPSFAALFEGPQVEQVLRQYAMALLFL